MSEFTKAQLDEAVAKAVAKSEEGVAGLKAKISELMDETKEERRKRQEVEAKIAEQEELEERAKLEAKGEYDKILEKERAKRTEAENKAQKAEAARRQTIVDRELTESLVKANVAPHLLRLVKNDLLAKATVEGEGDDLKAVVEGKNLGDFVTEWAGTDEGKNFIAAPNSSGGGASGGSSGGSGANPFSKDSFNLTEQAKLARENPERASQLKQEAGVA